MRAINYLYGIKVFFILILTAFCIDSNAQISAEIGVSPLNRNSLTAQRTGLYFQAAYEGPKQWSYGASATMLPIRISGFSEYHLGFYCGHTFNLNQRKNIQFIPSIKLGTVQTQYVYPYSGYFGQVNIQLRYYVNNNIGINLSHGTSYGYIKSTTIERNRRLRTTEQWQWLFPELLKIGLSYKFNESSSDVTK
ncbi:MAG: hypothetical protein JXR19_04585 [Bacteroidia bacterium]